MPIRPALQQLEKYIDDALRKNDFKPLRALLQIDISEDVKIKCSKQFLQKLDDLICRELDKKDIQIVSIILMSVGRCGKNIIVLGKPGLLTMMKQGLLQKMVFWFEKSEEIIISRGRSKDEAVLNMIEDLFDLLMVIYDINDAGKKQVVESFIPRICALVIDSRVNICIQQEALKKMNAILDRIPHDAKKVLSKQEILTLMSHMGERILDVGDYDIQVSIVEALCRMTTEKKRQELSSQWFSMDFIANAFKGIKDSEFETDCRIFLNLVNGMLGDKRRVFTFPCLSAFLDKCELQIPSDEKLEEFWIDFNLGSQTLSFYISGDDDDHQWEAVTVPEDKVQMYSIEVRESKKLLTVIMKNIVRIGKREGKELFLYFDASLEITSVTKKVFGENKYKEFTRKQGISVAKTSIHILFDASGSQILVPENQSSPVQEDLVILKENANPQKRFANPPKHNKGSKQGVRETTPSKRIKPPLQLINSSEKAVVSKTSENGMGNAMSLKPRPFEGRKRVKTNKHTRTAEFVENIENEDTEFLDQNFNELKDTYPDSPTVEKTHEPVLPGDVDISENKTHSKWSCWTPVTTIKICTSPRMCNLPGDTFNKDVVVNKKRAKRSASDEDPEETQKAKSGNEIVRHNKINEREVLCQGNNQEHHPKNAQEKNTESTRNDWHIESETTFKSVLLNTTTEESLIYKKKCILSKDVNTTICDKSPSRKNMKSHMKSGRELTSELNSYELEQKAMKEKSKGKGFTGAAESLISQINKRHSLSDNTESARQLKESSNGSIFANRFDQQLSKVQKKSYRKLQTTFANVTSGCPLNDVYNFSLNGTDEPVIKLGIQEFQATTRETSMDNSIKLVGLRSHDEHKLSLKRKDKRITSHKTLFSDSETECGCDDSKTDISWLREPQAKRQLMDYSRSKSVKREKSGKSRLSLEKRQSRSTTVLNKNITKKDDEMVPDGRSRHPRRATKTKKNYKDLSTSESESEQDSSYSCKDKLPAKGENIRSRTQTMNRPHKQQTLFLAEASKGQPSKELRNSSEFKDRRENNLDFSSLSVSGSPSSVEVMRCVEKITERDFTQDYDYITKSLSPYPKTASPELLRSDSKVGGQRNAPRFRETNVLCAGRSSSPSPGLPFLPRHTPSKNNSSVNRKNVNSVVLKRGTQNGNSYLDISYNSSEKHFTEIASPNGTENQTQSKKEESRAASPSLSGERTEKMWVDRPSDNAHASEGPSHHRCKQMRLEDNLSSSEVEEAEEQRAHLFPKGLSKGEDAGDTLKMFETSPLLLTPECFIPENCQHDFLDTKKLYDSVSTVYKKKTDTQHKIMDEFTKQTLKLVQQHLKTLNHQARERRDENLDKFQLILLDVVEKFEKDSQLLKDLEKELVDFEETLVQRLRAYSRNEQQRLHSLKTSLDENIVDSNSCYEETVFTSEVCCLKESMKTLQDRLLKEMHEEELLNIRRGLASLFRVHEESANV
ncbi:synaptonemal complex protein 2 [Nannospalax galili]|nr:synaptonemal complex protein 2 [Nannospalax galili]